MWVTIDRLYPPTHDSDKHIIFSMYTSTTRKRGLLKNITNIPMLVTDNYRNKDVYKICSPFPSPLGQANPYRYIECDEKELYAFIDKSVLDLIKKKYSGVYVHLDNLRRHMFGLRPCHDGDRGTDCCREKGTWLIPIPQYNEGADCKNDFYQGHPQDRNDQPYLIEFQVE